MKVLLLAAAMAVAAPAAAQSAATPPAVGPSFSLGFSSAAGCPTDQALVTAILARVPTAQRVESGGDIEFRVEISNGGSSSLEVKLPEGASRREIQDASCEEATTTIALIASLVLDARPGERLQATELSPLPAAPEPQAKLAPARPVEARRPARPRPTSVSAKLSPPAATPDVRYGLDLGVAFETAVASSPPVGVTGGITLLWLRPGFWSPELRADFLATTTAVRAAEAGSMTLRLLAGRLSACPVRLPASTTVAVAGCATFDYGLLTGRGDESINGTESRMPWLAGGVLARAELRLGRVFDLELGLGVKALANHDRFTVKPGDLVIYDVPAVSVGFSAGGAFRL